MEIPPRQVFPFIYFYPVPFHSFFYAGVTDPALPLHSSIFLIRRHSMSNLSPSSPRSSPPSSQLCALLRKPAPHHTPPLSPVQPLPALPSSSWHSRHYSACGGADDGASATGRSRASSVSHPAPPSWQRKQGTKWTCHFRVRLSPPWTNGTRLQPRARTATAVRPVASAAMVVPVVLRHFTFVIHFRVRSPRCRIHKQKCPYPPLCPHPPRHSRSHVYYAPAPRNRGPYSMRASGHRRRS
jgi:hypothetical protein